MPPKPPYNIPRLRKTLAQGIHSRDEFQKPKKFKKQKFQRPCLKQEVCVSIFGMATKALKYPNGPGSV